MTVVAVGLAHAAVLEALHGQCFDAGWSADDFARLLATPGTAALLALDGEEPAGLALTRVAADECELLTICTMPSMRGRGLARALLGASLTAACAGGAATCFLDVAEDNQAALALYYSFGFAQVGRRANYYRRAGSGVAALVLALDLQVYQQSADGERGKRGLR